MLTCRLVISARSPVGAEDLRRDQRPETGRGHHELTIRELNGQPMADPRGNDINYGLADIMLNAPQIQWRRRRGGGGQEPWPTNEKFKGTSSIKSVKSIPSHMTEISFICSLAMN